MTVDDIMDIITREGDYFNNHYCNLNACNCDDIRFELISLEVGEDR